MKMPLQVYSLLRGFSCKLECKSNSETMRQSGPDWFPSEARGGPGDTREYPFVQSNSEGNKSEPSPTDIFCVS